MNMIRRILFVVILLVAFAMVFTVTAMPSHASTLEGDCVYIEDYSPDVDKPASISPDTQFELYKVGSFVVGPPYVELDEPYSEMGVSLPSWTKEESEAQPVAWTKDWLQCAKTLDNNIKAMSDKPEPILIDVNSDGTFSKENLEKGLYLLRGDSQPIENYPKTGVTSYWWPQPMLVSILSDNVEIHVKPMSGVVHHMKVVKDWQWPSGISESVKKLVQPKTIQVELYYGETLKKTVTLPDADNNWYFKWDTAPDEDDPNEWSVKEVIQDDPATKIDESKEFYKNFTVTVGEVQTVGNEEVITITNKYDRDSLELTKTLDSFVESGGGSILLSFELSGYKGDTRIYHKFVGMTFDANSGDSQTLPVKDIPLGLDRLMVKEVSSSYYTPDKVEKEATPPLKNENGTKGPYTVSFSNSLRNQIYNSGVINKFKLTENGYEFDKSQGTGE